MFRFALIPVTALVLFFVQPSLAEEWKIIHAEGRDYVSFANVAQFYHFPEYHRANRTISLQGDRRGIRAQAGTSEFFINNVRFLSDFPLLTTADDNLISASDVTKIIEPVLRPSKIPGPNKVETVVLDPGHGGTDSGTNGFGVNEKNAALDVARTAREELLRAGFHVEMTRTDDQTISLEQRVAFANRFANAVFVSIHFNSATGASGVESYALAPAGVSSNASSENHLSSNDTNWYPGNNHDATNIALAAAVHASILARVAPFDRGVRHARFHVLRDITVPAVLVEAGFLTDPVEGARIAAPRYRQELGRAVAQGILSYNNAVNFQSSAATLTRLSTNLPPHTHSINDPLDATVHEKPAPDQKPSAVIHTSN